MIHRRASIYCLLLTVATLAVYLPVLHCSFVNLDDPAYVLKNHHIRQLNWQTVRWASTYLGFGYPTPITWISHALDYQLYGLNPEGHHISNLLLHLVNVLLVFLLLGRATGRTGPSLFVAALFALHPLNVESVAWIAERKTLLSMTFFLLALAAYGWYAAMPSVKRYLVVGALFALGLMAKPMIITLPCVLLLVDFWPLQRIRMAEHPRTTRQQRRAMERKGRALPGPISSRLPQYSLRRLIFEKLPLLPLVLASTTFSVYGQRVIIAAGAIPFADRLRLAAVSELIAYPSQMFYPAYLSVSYPWSVPESSMVLLSIALFAGASLIAWWQRRSRPYLLVGVFWFLGTMVPMSSIVFMGSYVCADRYMYLPMIGLFVALVWSAADWRGNQLVLMAVAILIVLSILTRRQVGVWQDSGTLWHHWTEVMRTSSPDEEAIRKQAVVERDEQDVARDPTNAAAHTALAEALSGNADRPVYEIAEYRKALALTASPASKAILYDYIGVSCEIYGLDAEARESFDHMADIYRQLPPSELSTSIQAVRLYVKVHPPTKNDTHLAPLVQLAVLEQIAGMSNEATLDQIHVLDTDFNLSLLGEQGNKQIATQ
jgi:protein O-mannosyl-transferase